MKKIITLISIIAPLFIFGQLSQNQNYTHSIQIIVSNNYYLHNKPKIVNKTFANETYVQPRIKTQTQKTKLNKNIKSIYFKINLYRN